MRWTGGVIGAEKRNDLPVWEVGAHAAREAGCASRGLLRGAARRRTSASSLPDDPAKHKRVSPVYRADVLTVRSIWRYPVKSMGGEQLDRAAVGTLGLAGDRTWGVRDIATGMVLTGRRTPRLLMATARLATDGTPVITGDDGRHLTTSEELSAWLGRSVELVRADDGPGEFENPRDIDREEDWVSWLGPVGSFHDRPRVSLVSLGSIGGHDRRRFRANLLLDGEGEDELAGRDVRLGEVVLQVATPIPRCIMVARAQPGVPADLDVLKRIIRERDNRMGIGAEVLTPGVVTVGDTLRDTRGDVIG